MQFENKNQFNTASGNRATRYLWEGLCSVTHDSVEPNSTAQQRSVKGASRSSRAGFYCSVAPPRGQRVQTEAPNPEAAPNLTLQQKPGGLCGICVESGSRLTQQDPVADTECCYGIYSMCIYVYIYMMIRGESLQIVV